jgi:hypothetical protein
VEYQARGPDGEVLVTRETSLAARGDGAAVMVARGLGYLDLFVRPTSEAEWEELDARIVNPKYDNDFPR